MSTSRDGLELIAKWEGCVLTPYRDIAGLRTIGFGHLIKPGESFPDGVPITRDRALDLLALDVKSCEEAIHRNFPGVDLTQNQFDALVSFGFNCGTGVYGKTGVADAIRRGDFDSVPSLLREWSKATIGGKKQVVPGLLNRRIHEGQVFSGASIKPVVTWTPSLLAEVQGVLKRLGHYDKKIDGLYGPGTARALDEYGASRSLDVGSTSQGLTRELLEALRSET